MPRELKLGFTNVCIVFCARLACLPCHWCVYLVPNKTVTGRRISNIFSLETIQRLCMIKLFKEEHVLYVSLSITVTGYIKLHIVLLIRYEYRCSR